MPARTYARKRALELLYEAEQRGLNVGTLLEERIAALERGVGGIATASGQAALHLAIATIAGAGSHIVASRALYGGSHNLLHYTLRRFGIETTFVDPRDGAAWRSRF